MNQNDFSQDEWQVVRQGIARLRASVMATTFAIVGGFGLFFATVWLLVQARITGAAQVGPTLGLLGNYFPGYNVTWPGAFLGIIYGAAVGAISGYVVAFVYNRISSKLHRTRQTT